MATIDLIVLGILKKESLSAYDIQKLVEYRNISKWVKISTPSIYKKVIQLEEKGYIGYKVYGNTHQYYALVSEDDYRRNSLKQVIDKYYDNSYTRVVSTLIEEEALMIDELQELIRQIKNK